MEFQQLDVRTRQERGKGASRKIRATGRIPGVIYGGELEPVSIDLEPRHLRKALQGPHRRNTVIELVLDGGKGGNGNLLAMLQDYQIHPSTRDLLHVDFVTVDLERNVDVEVPLVTTGKCQGIQMGGVLLQVYHELPLECRPADIPVQIEYDITALEIGDTVKASQLPVTEGVRVKIEPDQTILSISAPAAEEEEEAPEEGEEAEGEEAEGEQAPATEEGKKPEEEKKE